MPRSKPMCKFQILMNSEGYRFGAGLWTVTVRGQGGLPPVRSENIERLQEFPPICEGPWPEGGRDGGAAGDFGAAEALTSMVNRS